MTLAERLRSTREAAGLTQVQLAAKSNLGLRTVIRMETGEETHPRLKTLQAVADALGCTPAELFADSGEAA